MKPFKIVGFGVFMDNSEMIETLVRWHQFIETRNARILNEILADDVKFHSPFVWNPKLRKMPTTAILTAATEVFQNFRHVREIAQGGQFCLEFEAAVGEFSLRGVDLIGLDTKGKINDLEVMIRPANALQKLGEAMRAKLAVKGSA